MPNLLDGHPSQIGVEAPPRIQLPVAATRAWSWILYVGHRLLATTAGLRTLLLAEASESTRPTAEGTRRVDTSAVRGYPIPSSSSSNVSSTAHISVSARLRYQPMRAQISCGPASTCTCNSPPLATVPTRCLPAYTVARYAGAPLSTSRILTLAGVCWCGLRSCSMVLRVTAASTARRVHRLALP